MRHDREFAQDGPTFTHLKSAQPRASDAEIKQAIITAVRFEDACFKYFERDNIVDYWDRCVRAVARAAKENPDLSRKHLSAGPQRRRLLL